MLLKNPDKCESPNPDFIYDEACLDIVNYLAHSVTVSGQYEECDGCKFQTLATVEAGFNVSLLINTRYPLLVNYTNAITNNTCKISNLFYEHYRYGWNLTEKCMPVFIKEPADNAYLPILTAFIILFAFGTLWYMIKCIYKCTKDNETLRRYIAWSNELENDLGNLPGTSLVIERPPPIRKHPHRVKSIDVYRGLCIMLMIFVNYGGGEYWFFKHSIWNGLTVADLVFPWFMWLMGMSLTISLNNKLRRAVPRRQLFVQVLRRSVVLILLGLMVHSHARTTPVETIRIPGVLQRFGVTYFIVGVIEVAFAKRSVSVNEYGRLSFLQDIIVAIPQWLIMIVIVFVHTAITFIMEVPGCGRGYLGPGGLHDLGFYNKCTGGAAGYIDRMVFGQHMYKSPSCHVLYETVVYYDPEGILGTLTSVLLVYFGVQAGRILHTYSNVKTRMIRWLSWGFAIALLGGALCGFSKNSGPIPINKNLWSLSFVLATAGTAFIIESYLFLMVDILRKWGGRPLFYPGMNPIFLYIGHELLRNTFPFAWKPLNETHGAYLGMNLWGMTLWVVVSVFMYKQNMFLSI